jgi:hypothetical protein
MPPKPQPKAPAKTTEKDFANQSFLFTTKRVAKDPIPPAQAAPCSWPNWPRIAQAVPSDMATTSILKYNCFDFIELTGLYRKHREFLRVAQFVYFDFVSK